ncbi:MAG: 4-hydroxy-tetrahydrodipicolinate reductase [Candidatus Sericytochromatia bacterium]|nr:MAG: 4-hydroxy-tetrahydrodipicolinate reductase [Candidatus Sericytochromatia bacterium]
MKKILIAGCTGKMGLEAVKTILKTNDFRLYSCLGNKNYINEDIGNLIGKGNIGITITNNLEKSLEDIDIVLDLTNVDAGYNIIIKSLKKNIPVVSGSTGFNKKQLDEFKSLSEEKKISCYIIPNFSIGVVLMTKFAKEAGKFFENVEIIEYHHENKKDYPSGTAIKTAEMLAENSKTYNHGRPEEIAKIENCRGGNYFNINIHSIRMPGFIATQEVLFGSIGEVLTIKHQTINREAFMSGILFCLRKAINDNNFVYGMDNII